MTRATEETAQKDPTTSWLQASIQVPRSANPQSDVSSVAFPSRLNGSTTLLEPSARCVSFLIHFLQDRAENRSENSRAATQSLFTIIVFILFVSS